MTFSNTPKSLSDPFADVRNMMSKMKPRERILFVAERMFAEEGLGSVSIRSITAAAQVNLASLHYHFGSKEALLEAIFTERARPIAEERMRMLHECKEGPDRPPLLEQVLEAFLYPALTYSAKDQFSGHTFARLRARLSVEPKDLSRRILSATFDDSSRAFIDALTRAVPDLPRNELEWRFHFLLGSMVYSMADSGRIQSITGGACNPSDGEETIRHLIPFLAAGFRAPLPLPRNQVSVRPTHLL